MTNKLLRAGAWLAAVLALLAGGAYAYYLSLDLEQLPKADPSTTVAGLAYLDQAVSARRGRILAVVSSTERGGPGLKKAATN